MADMLIFARETLFHTTIGWPATRPTLKHTFNTLHAYVALCILNIYISVIYETLNTYIYQTSCTFSN